MIKSIYVKNFILIDALQLSFPSQFSCFTGETGAGKSLLIDAISLLCGSKVSSSYIQKGKDKAIVEACIELRQGHPAHTKLVEAGFDIDDEMIVSREFSLEGKSVNRCNHRNISVSLLKEVMNELIDIHSQHDNQLLLNSKHHIHLLDTYIKDESKLQQIKQAYQLYSKEKKQLELLVDDEVNAKELDYLQFQLEEIEQLDLKEGEYENLLAQEKAFAIYEKDANAIGSAILDFKSIRIDELYDVAKALEKSESVQVQEIREQILNAYYNLDEQVSALQTYKQAMQYDVKEYDAIQSRIFEIHKMFRKHGNSYVLLMQTRDALQARIDASVNRDACIQIQEKIVEEAKLKFYELAKAYQQKRKQYALTLQKEIQKELYDLSLQNARFEVVFEQQESALGLDQVEFFVAMNKGEQLQPLQKVASGGELSRLMLGLKTIFSRIQPVQTIIFDEIDNGVSGSVASMIGEKMHQIGANKQVFCVTHLAAVAAHANTHYLVSKHDDEVSTHSQIEQLNESQSIEQLAMLSFGSLSEQAMKASAELYMNSRH